jgi:hypothetical protein
VLRVRLTPVRRLGEVGLLFSEDCIVVNHSEELGGTANRDAIAGQADYSSMVSRNSHMGTSMQWQWRCYRDLRDRTKRWSGADGGMDGGVELELELELQLESESNGVPE